MNRFAILAIVTLLPALIYADRIAGPGSYPQFRSLAGLPGSGFGVTKAGELSFNGAMSISTPVAYSLSNFNIFIGGGIFSGNSKFRFDTTEGQLLKSNGTLVGMIGIPLGKFGSLTATHMVLSTKGDNSQNFHWQLPFEQKNINFGIGVQDISGQGGTEGQTSGPSGFDPGESRTYYGVVTYNLENGHSASLGFGDGRFKGRFFASANYLATPRIKLIAEWDTFGLNSGLAYDLGKITSIGNGRDARATISAGFLDFHHAYWTFGVSF